MVSLICELLKKKKAKSIETENIMVVVRVWESEVE